MSSEMRHIRLNSCCPPTRADARVTSGCPSERWMPATLVPVAEGSVETLADEAWEGSENILRQAGMGAKYDKDAHRD